MKDAVQEQFVAARRNQILDAAARVFAEKGFHPTTIKDIAREAGLADGTLYNYFENKTALLLGIMERMREHALQSAPPPPPEPIDLRSLMRLYLQIVFEGQDFALTRVVISEMMVNAELRTRYQQTIMEPTLAMAAALFIEYGLPPERVNLLVRVISGLVTGLVIQHILDDSFVQANWAELPARLTDLLLNGIEGTAS
jgi:TetR/AcrR family fatty acid metabolism transcriptional regulator